MTLTSTRIATLTAQVSTGARHIRLLPAGEFRASDGSGRPTDVPTWRMDATLAAAVIARYAARQSQAVVDYEHQTLAVAQNGLPAPAAGWITALHWQPASVAADDPNDPNPDAPGLYATIDWTPRASAMLTAREYRYISPVFSYARNGDVLDILHAGLTNNPGLDGLTDLAALSAHPFFHQELPPMKDLLKALGLGETASEAEALAALAALKAASTAALSARPDPAHYVPAEAVVSLQAKVAELTAQMAKNEIDEMVSAGMADGRILPDLEAWARSLNAVALKGFLGKAKPIAALSGMQTGGLTVATATAVCAADVETAMRIGGWDAAVFATKKD